MTNWPTKKLGEICEIEGGDAAPQDKTIFENGTIPFVRMQDLGRYHITTNLIETVDKITNEALQKFRLKIWPKGSILLPRSGSVYMNHRAILGIDACVVSHIAILTNFSKEILNKYLFYYLTILDIGRFGTQTTGIDSISFSQLGRLKIPLPPLNIQQKIVERLDAIKKAQELNDKQIELAEELFQSLLHRELDPKGKNWEMKRLGEVANFQYGYTESAKERGNFCFIRITDIDDNGELINLDKKYIQADEKEVLPYILEKSDLLIARTGATFGKMLYFDSVEPSVFASYLIRVKPNKNIIIPKLIWLFSRTSDYWKQAWNLMTGSGQQQFNANKIKRIKIPLPPLETQQKIVEKLSAVQEYKKKLVQQKELLKELFESVLHKSMAGKFD